MTTVAYVLILAAIIVAKQTAAGRVMNLGEDISDAFLALARGDAKGLTEVLARKGDSTTLDSGQEGTFAPHVAGAADGSMSGVAAAAVNLGTAAKGYKFTATGPDYYDCSGLMWRACQKAGVFPTSGKGSFRFTTYDVGSRTAYFHKVSNPAPGDIVVWPTHHMGVITGTDKYYSARSEKLGIGYSTISGHGDSHYYLRANGSVANQSQKNKVADQLKG